MKKTQRFAKAKALFVMVTALISLFASTSTAEIVQVKWITSLNLLPGMESELPSGVSNGQQVSGSFSYDTESGWFSGSNDGRVRNYPTVSWVLDLGDGNIFSRTQDDGRGNLGSGEI